MYKTLPIICLLFILHLNSYSQKLIKIERIDSISIIFKFGSAKIDKKAQIIERLNKLQINEIGLVKMNAYTDTVGNELYNNRLASNRLKETDLIFKKSKLKLFTIDTLNLNEKRNSSFTNDSLYRRVDILVYKTTPNYKVNTPIDLKINFEGGTDILLKSSYASLLKLKLSLQMDSTISIKLLGHVCCGPEQNLSLKRAQQVKKYLVQNKINEKRISCEGFSNTKNLVPDNTEKNNVINRRVEVIFISKTTAKISK